MLSFLRGTPMVAIRPHLMTDPCPDFLEDFDLFVAYLRTNYGDPNKLGTARRKLKALRQTSSAAAYFAKIMQYLAVLGWKDPDPIIDRAINGLKLHLKDEVAPISLIALVVPLDNRLHERDQERKKETPSDASNNFEMRQAKVGSTFELRRSIGSDAPVQSCVAKISATPIPFVQHAPTPSATSSTICGPLTDVVRKCCYNEGLCLCCSKAGHNAIDCPAKRQFPCPGTTTTSAVLAAAGNARGPTT